MSAATELSSKATHQAQPQPAGENASDPSNSSQGIISSKEDGTGESRKRTKTGCAVCRRRRIKCGEERPTCSNCRRSKRQCEGYNQRVVFKDPLNTYKRPSTLKSNKARGAQGASAAAAQSSLPKQHVPETVDSSMAAGRGNGFPSDKNPVTTENLPGQSDFSLRDWPTSVEPPPTAPIDFSMNGTSLSSPSGHTLLDHAGKSRTSLSITSIDHGVHAETDKQMKIGGAESMNYNPEPLSHNDGLYAGSSVTQDSNRGSFTWPLDEAQYSQDSIANASARPAYDNGVNPNRGTPYALETAMEPELPGLLARQKIWADEVDTDMESHHEDVGEREDLNISSDTLGMVVALQAAQDRQDQRMRSYTSSLEGSNMLANYFPSSQASPLNDPQCAKIFCYFINVVAPSMSLFERNPAQSSLIFSGHSVPESQQHIWTYTMPILALGHHGLLHAMLALASLQIGKLQGSSVTASLKHYHIALRRTAKSVGLPTRRGHPATLAASMLLAYYECMSSDHQKWSSHLSGASQLVKEIDFQRPNSGGGERHHGFTSEATSIQMMDSNLTEASSPNHEPLIATILGENYVRRRTQNERDDISMPISFSARNLAMYENQRDICWWFCKQDVYQSLLGGGRLFMEFERWGECPPRAAVGLRDAVYGTFDHIIALLARVADFGANDLQRKRMALSAKAQKTRRDSAMPEGSGTGISNQQATSSDSRSRLHPVPLPFTGMVPHKTESTPLPMGFTAPPPSHTLGESRPVVDLETATREAEHEWSLILSAFDALRDALGDDFEPLGPEYSQSIDTPFGPAHQYRTYGIASAWMHLYMGLIVCHRLRPSMPPAAMVAAGIAAKDTAFFANEIGRIAAGISPNSSNIDAVNPAVGAGLVDCSITLFFAGIQYQDFAQRQWTLSKLHDIVRLVGWQSASAVASGCEKAWMKAAEMGRGAPWAKGADRPTSQNKSGIWVADERDFEKLVSGNEEGSATKYQITRTDRTHYALGLLGVEEDLQKLHVEG